MSSPDPADTIAAISTPLGEAGIGIVRLSGPLAAPIAASAEHLFPLLILIGLATRFSALALLVMTATIQLLVYPDAYPTHGVWAAVLLFLIAKGPGMISVDRLIARRFA